MNTAEILSTKRDPVHNYSAPGTYHLLFETEEWDNSLGRIYRGHMILNALGEIFLTVLALALHRFPCAHVRAIDIRPHCVEMVLVLSGWRLKLRQIIDKVKWSKLLDPLCKWIHFRRTMTIPLFVGYVKMNSGRQINSQRGVVNAAVWTRRYKARVMTDEAEIAQLCAELDARSAKLRLRVQPESAGEPVVSMASSLISALDGILGDQPSLCAAIDAPEQRLDTMLLGRAFFLTGSMLDPVSEPDDWKSDASAADRPGEGGRSPGMRIWSIGAGRLFLSGPEREN